MNDVPEFYAKNRQAWRHWLLNHHQSERAVWLIFDKGPNRTMTWTDIVQEALCFGWIDSKPGKVSETQSKIYISRRNPKSAWSKINKEHVDKLIATNLMQQAGLDAIAVAKENGAWKKLTISDNLIVPSVLQKKFDKNPVAYENYTNFSNSTKRRILEWIYDAKTTDTRNRRINETVIMAENNQKAR